jgi:hypothetical protein
MLSYGLILFVQVACLIHVGRTGRPYFWFMIILFVPGLGIIAYLVVEVIPGLLKGRAAARLSQTVSAGLDPTRQYREFARAVETVPSVANFWALADECVRLERHEEAIDLYKSALTGMHETEPGVMLGLATAEFRKGDANAASATLDRLFRGEPGFQLRRSRSARSVYPRSQGSLARGAQRLRAALRDLSRRGSKGQDGAAASMDRGGAASGRDLRRDPQIGRTRPRVLSQSAAGMVRDRAPSCMN